jgi:hypothetical protein
VAIYKVIQDIEAEDKLLGPLTLRQFIYAVIVVVTAFITFKLAIAAWYLALPFLPIIVFFALLAAPFGHDQPSEVWMLAKVRFFLKPRRRIWDQSGMKELVTITVPKRIEKHLTKDLSQTEVRSRLQALANTIDSRGWAVKNVNVNLYSQPSYAVADTSDRLVDPALLPQDVPTFDVQPSDDMLDERANPAAQQLDQMINASSQAHREQVIEQMNHPLKKSKKKKDQESPADYWFLNGPVNPAAQAAPGYAAFDTPPVVLPGQSYDQNAKPSTPAPTADERAVLEKIKAEKAKPNPAYGHLRTIQPLSAQKESEKKKQDQPEVTATPNPAIIELANNDDLNVATIARQANKANGKKPPNDEVVISLR